MNLPQQRERVTVDGLGNIGAGKYTKTKSKQSLINERLFADEKSKNNSNKVLENLFNNDIIKEKGDSQNVRKTGRKESRNNTKGNLFRSGSKLFSDENQERLYRHERILSGNNYETAILYDNDGNIILKKKGEKSRVSFTKQEINKMKGGILTHNHPNGSTFSPSDINMLRYGDLAEIRACTNQGTYILRRADIWDERISSLAEIEKDYREIELNLSGKYRDKAAREGKSIIYYLDDLDDECMRVFSKRHNLEFIWEAKK